MKIPVPEGLQLPPDNGGMITLTAEFKLDDGELELVSLEGVPIEMEDEDEDEGGDFMAAVERGLAQPS